MNGILRVWLAAGGLTLLAACEKPSAPMAAPTAPPPTQVVAVEARRQSVQETLALVGTLAADEMVEIKAETEGTILEINFEEGQAVESGRLLFRLDESKLEAAVQEAEGNYRLSQANFNRAQELWRGKLISQQEFDQAAATFDVNRASLDLRRRQLKDARIHAPFAGVMGARTISAGQVIARNTTLGCLVKLDPVKVEVNVPERFLGQLKIGQRSAITVAAFPTNRFTGEVYFIAPHVEPATRTALVKARLANPGRQLRPGMFANLDLTLRLREAAVVIPESALVPTGERVVVYVVDRQLVAQLRPVLLGVRLAGLVEILSGVQAGELVITEGLQKVRPGGTVKLAAPASAPPTPADAQQSP